MMTAGGGRPTTTIHDDGDDDVFQDEMMIGEYEDSDDDDDDDGGGDGHSRYSYRSHQHGRRRGRTVLAVAVSTTIIATLVVVLLRPEVTQRTTTSSRTEGTDAENNIAVDEDDVILPTSTIPFDLRTGNQRLQDAYNLAKKEFYDNIIMTKDESDAALASANLNDGHGHGSEGPFFIAGSGWTELWTRDTSYAIELAGGLLEPRVSLLSLLKCTEEVELEVGDDDDENNNNNNENKTVWYQDACGHFGGWPNLSDAIVGVRGAWSLFLYTGNTTFLKYAFDVTLNSLQRAERDAYRNGLFHGCSSFMESNSGYPLKYRNNGTLVGQTKALSTNLLYYNGYRLAAEMGLVLLEEEGGATPTPTAAAAAAQTTSTSRQITNDTIKELDEKAKALKASIRERFWMEEKGYYSYMEDENNRLVDQMEGLGESLVLMSDDFEDSGHRRRSILDKTYSTDIGIPSLWPQFDHGDIPIDDKHISQRYHNGRIWPFVMGYYAIAAARNGRIDIFADQMMHLMDLSEQNKTFAEFYDLDKTFPHKRRRQLWSDTAFLSMVIKGLFGMTFHVDGVTFSPNKPFPRNFVPIDETISLLNVKYREAVLDIHVKGFGNRVTSFQINGRPFDDPKLSPSSVGRQIIEIEVSNSL